jgi:ketosteroid isomerase-like protein
MRSLIPTTVLLTILLVAFTSWADDTKNVAKEIHETNEHFMKAFRAGDAAAVASLYTRDAQLLPPNYDAVNGTEAIEAFWQGFIDMGLMEVQLVSREVIPMGEMAVEIGEYSVFGQGETLLDRGKLMVVWKKENGVQRLHRDIWNSSIPLPVPAAESP